MPECKKCYQNFSKRLRVGNKIKRLNNRKHCLDCVPFNSTKKKYSGSISECIICGKNYIYKKGKGCTLERCNGCIVRQRRLRFKKLAVDYKGGACQNCGYKRCLSALSFHHRNPKEKDFNVSGNLCRSWKSVKKELDKCDLLCHNCHAEKHLEMENDRIQRNFSNYVKHSRAIIKVCDFCKKDFKIPLSKDKKRKHCSNKCLLRSPYSNRGKISIPKNEMEELIWKIPMTKIAKMLNVSDGAIKKFCLRWQIKIPPRGHWLKGRSINPG